MLNIGLARDDFGNHFMNVIIRPGYLAVIYLHENYHSLGALSRNTREISVSIENTTIFVTKRDLSRGERRGKFLYFSTRYDNVKLFNLSFSLR